MRAESPAHHPSSPCRNRFHSSLSTSSSAPKTARPSSIPPFVPRSTPTSPPSPATPIANVAASLKTQSPALAAFAWQRGYGAFSVGPSDLDALRDYIDTQEEHHRTVTFQEEYRGFLTKYGIAYDERYV